MYLSLKGLVNAVNEGATRETLTEHLSHVSTADSDVVQLDDHSEELSAAAVCNGSVTTSTQDDNDVYNDTCRSGYCVACLSGNYPTALDW